MKPAIHVIGLKDDAVAEGYRARRDFACSPHKRGWLDRMLENRFDMPRLESVNDSSFEKAGYVCIVKSAGELSFENFYILCLDILAAVNPSGNGGRREVRITSNGSKRFLDKLKEFQTPTVRDATFRTTALFIAEHCHLRGGDTDERKLHFVPCLHLPC
ncbi:hypothetical protein TSAR_015647 [Trichomalopsis sarcophagae]|uniref:Uncharacterized protein n=1 Tax=Trichomalopsis sarcophagae TaxID=543379 RepID=A0A232F6L3_9HYME|nr:hypothetical protein TSAR_015647 [Trichomalopsis sarcophagae]